MKKRIIATVLTVGGILFIFILKIPIGQCGEESAYRTHLGVYACAGWSDESHDNGCRKIAGVKGYFTISELTEAICDGHFLKDN